MKLTLEIGQEQVQKDPAKDRELKELFQQSQTTEGDASVMLAGDNVIRDFLGNPIKDHPGSFYKPPCPTDQ